MSPAPLGLQDLPSPALLLLPEPQANHSQGFKACLEKSGWSQDHGPMGDHPDVSWMLRDGQDRPALSSGPSGRKGTGVIWWRPAVHSALGLDISSCCVLVCDGSGFFFCQGWDKQLKRQSSFHNVDFTNQLQKTTQTHEEEEGEKEQLTSTLKSPSCSTMHHYIPKS
uniref:Uncharacterized protein n=1 Tax=Zosterops lateralis melanops TaxID=1220523 RepID=A0A8D2QKQ7_ZOSLA